MIIAPEPPYDSAEQAEKAFYAAFEARNIEIMRAVWSHREDALCVHPMGQPLIGWPDIERSWQAIFDGIGEARFSLSDLRVYGDDRVSVRYVHENIHHGPGYSGLSTVLATNVYRLENDGWRMVSHHASPGGVVNEPDGERPVH